MEKCCEKICKFLQAIGRPVVEAFYWIIFIGSFITVIALAIFCIYSIDKRIRSDIKLYNKPINIICNEKKCIINNQIVLKDITNIENTRLNNDFTLIIAISAFFTTVIGIFIVHNFFKGKEVDEKIKKLNDLEHKLNALSEFIYANYINQIKNNVEYGYTTDTVQKHLENSIDYHKDYTDRAGYNLGIMYKDDFKDNYRRALNYLKKSQKISEKLGNKDNFSDFYIKIIHFQQNKVNSQELFEFVKKYKKDLPLKYVILLRVLTEQYSYYIRDNGKDNTQRQKVIISVLEKIKIDTKLSQDENMIRRIKNTLWVIERYGDLIDLLTPELNNDPSNQNIYFELAFAYICDGKIKEGVWKLEKAQVLSKCNMYKIISKTFRTKEELKRRTRGAIYINNYKININNDDLKTILYRLGLKEENAYLLFSKL